METDQEQKVKYDSVEDLRFPVGLLFRAYDIYEARGYNAFYNFCQHVNMPANDIERVMNKYKYKRDPEFRDLIKSKLTQIQKKLDGTDFEITEEIPF